MELHTFLCNSRNPYLFPQTDSASPYRRDRPQPPPTKKIQNTAAISSLLRLTGYTKIRAPETNDFAATVTILHRTRNGFRWSCTPLSAAPEILRVRCIELSVARLSEFLVPVFRMLRMPVLPPPYFSASSSSRSFFSASIFSLCASISAAKASVSPISSVSPDL